MRRANRRDSSEKSIVTALEAAGAQVQRLDIVDLLVRFSGKLFLMECKTPGADLKRKDRKKQREFCAAWNVPIVCTPEQALELIGATSFKSLAEKYVLQTLYRVTEHLPE